MVALINNRKNDRSILYREFFAASIFDSIKQDIREPISSFHVVSIGLYPAVPQYNGFYTLDSYQNYYQLSYKKQFRKIIEKELNKSPYFEQYFDSWGNRCYMFISELGKKGYFITEDIGLNNLELNIQSLKALNCKYIFSAVKINNHLENSLQFLKYYSSPETPLKIYLYEIV